MGEFIGQLDTTASPQDTANAILDTMEKCSSNISDDMTVLTCGVYKS